MKVSDIITRVRNIAGDTNVLQFTDAMLVDWINDGVRECAIDNNLLQKRASQTVISGTSTVTMPTDILKMHSVLVNGSQVPLLTLEEFKIRVDDSNDSTGVPTLTYSWANTLNLWPEPDTNVEVTLDYIYDPAEVTTDDLDVTPALPVGYHARLVDYCLAQVAQQDDDSNRYALKMEEFRTGVKKLSEQSQTNENLYPSITVSARDGGSDYYDWTDW